MRNSSDEDMGIAILSALAIGAMLLFLLVIFPESRILLLILIGSGLAISGAAWLDERHVYGHDKK